MIPYLFFALIKAHLCFAIKETQFGVFDQLEIENESYEIEIQSQPVTERMLLNSEEVSDTALKIGLFALQSLIRMFSKRGQPYSCLIPSYTATNDSTSREDNQFVDVQQLLAPLKGTCVLLVS